MNAEDLVLNFKKGMANLSKTERRRAIESVRDVIRAAAFDDAAGSAYEIERCPRCGSAAVVKKGKAGNGEQRYLCRGCGRTFGMGSERILGTSKLPKETWMAYAECFVLMLPLRECAGVSVNIIFTISTNAFSPIAPTRIRRIRQRGCAAFGA